MIWPHSIFFSGCFQFGIYNLIHMDFFNVVEEYLVTRRVGEKWFAK